MIKDGVSKALGIPFGFVALGGASDGSFLEGHSYTYEGSTFGKIAEILIKTQCNNPIFFFDELDKVSSTTRGEEVIGVLTHLTDITQNDQFNDKYFGEINLNLSRSLFVFSYNDSTLINPVLKDRMITINVSGYSASEKVIIARDYLLPSIYKTFDVSTNDIVISENIIKQIIDIVPKEEGVRNLKRGLESVVSWINMYRYTKEQVIEYPYVVTDKFVSKHVTNKDGSTKDTEMINRMYL